MTNVDSLLTAYSAPSIRTLSRPIRSGDSTPSLDTYRKEFEALAFAMEHGDRATKAAAEIVAYRLLCTAITSGMLDRDRGPIPRLVEQIRQSIRSFEELVR